LKINVSKVAHLSGHRDSIYALCTHGTSEMLTGSADGMVVKWSPFETSDGTLVMKLPAPVYSLRTNPKGQIIAGSANGILYVGNLHDFEDVRAIQAHVAGIFDIIPYIDGYATASGDGTVAIWDADFNLMVRHSVSKKSIRTLMVMTDGILWCGSSDWMVYSLNPNIGITGTFEGHQQSVFALSADLKNQRVYSAGRDAQIIQRDHSGTPLQMIPAHLYSIHHLDIHPETGLMLSGSMDKTIKIWNTEPFQLLKVVDHARYQSHTNCVNKVLWIDPNHFISCADDRTAMVFQVEIIQDHDFK